jgi:hypothetical protein
LFEALHGCPESLCGGCTTPPTHAVLEQDCTGHEMDRQGLNDDQSLYLIPTFDNREEAMDLLEEIYAQIFSAELDLWCNDQSQWPKPRSFELFQQWFALSFYNLIEDMGKQPSGYLSCRWGFCRSTTTGA